MLLANTAIGDSSERVRKRTTRRGIGLALALWAMFAVPAFGDMLGMFGMSGANMYNLDVGGLAQQADTGKLEKSLQSLKDVEKVHVDHSHGQIMVWMKKGAKLDEPAVKQIVQSSGLTLKGIEPPK